MSLWTLVLRSLRYYVRAHLGVVLGAAVGSAALIGALVVGDSVRLSLKEMALSRLGKVGHQNQGNGLLLVQFQQQLAQSISCYPVKCTSRFIRQK